MQFGRMMDINVQDTLSQWGKDKPKAENGEKTGGQQPEPDAGGVRRGETRADEIADNALGDPSLEHELRVAAQRPKDEAAERQALIDGMMGEKEKAEREKARKKQDALEAQAALTATARASVAMKNVQLLVSIRNQEAFRDSLALQPDKDLKKSFGKGQTSTVQVPTFLMDGVKQQIGGMSSRTSQSDMMTGFLYWYLGCPDGLIFSSPEQKEKIDEIVERLGRNASPVRISQRSANVSEAILEKLGDIDSRMGNMAALLAMVSKDSLGVKSRTDKTYLALCYLALNVLMLAPPVSTDRPEDIDMLAGGLVWGMMSGIDEAYEYFRDTNGREIYKAKHGLKARQYRPPAPPKPAPGTGSYTPPAGMYGPQDANSGAGPDEDEDYEDIPDIPEDFDPLNDDFDDMGIGANMDDPALSDPDYDDGIEEGTPAYLKKKRDEAMLRGRIEKFEAEKEWHDGDGDGSGDGSS